MSGPFSSLKLAPEVKEVIHALLDVIHQNATTYEQLSPVLFMGGENSQELKIIPLDFSTQEAKQNCHQAIAELVKQSKPDFILKALEGYYLEQADAEEHLKGNFNSISENPKAKEGVFVSLETPFGDWTIKAEILPGRQLKWETEPQSIQSEGLLANLIPKVTVH